MITDQTVKIAIECIRKELAVYETTLKMYDAGWRRDPYWQEQDIKYATRNKDKLTKAIAELDDYIGENENGRL